MHGLKPKFGVGLLVLITLWVAGYLAGLRYGSDELQRMRDTLDVAIVTRTYDVADLVTGTGSAFAVTASLVAVLGLLSAPDSPETLKLPVPIPNDKKGKLGLRTAFTMNQRYVASSKLLAAKTTVDVE